MHLDAGTTANSRATLVRVVGWLLLVCFLWDLLSPAVQMLSVLTLSPMISAPAAETVLRSTLLFAAALGLVRTLVTWIGAPRVVWLGIVIYGAVDVAQIVLLGLRIGGWTSMDATARVGLVGALALPQVAGILGAWLGQRVS